jgi:predicted RNase H-like nuclease (RuvC/YqgF family)
MRILTIMSEEEESIHDNADLSNSEEEEAPTEPEIEPIAPELKPEPEVEIISSVTEESGAEEAAKIKPKKQTKSTIMKIQRSLVDTSKQIEKQTAQFNKINQNLQSLQKQFKLGQKQSEILIQMHSQINKIQRQISQIQKRIKRR